MKCDGVGMKYDGVDMGRGGMEPRNQAEACSLFSPHVHRSQLYLFGQLSLVYH